MIDSIHGRGGRRAFLWSCALLLAAASLTHTAVWLRSRGPLASTMTEDLGLSQEALLQPEVKLGFPLRYAADLGGVLVVGVDEGSPAQGAGLRAGDVILAIDGRSLRDSATPFLAVYRSARPGDSVELRVARPGEPEPVVIRAEFTSRPLAERLVPAMRAIDRTLRLFPVVFLAVALPVLFLRIDEPHAWRVAVFLVCIASVASTPAAPGTEDARVVGFAMAWRGTCNGLLAFFAYLFFSRFPARSPLDRRLPWLTWLLLGLGSLFALGGAGAGRQGHAWLPPPLAAALGDAATAALWHAYNYGGFALSLAAVVATLVSNPSRQERRRIRVLVFGSVCGLAPVVVLGLLADLGIWHGPGWVASLVYLLLYLFPLSFAYAVLKHRVLELPVLLKRSARYVLVKRGFLVLLVLIGAQASAFFAVSLGRTLRLEPSLATTAGVGFGFLLAGVAAPAIRRATRLIDRSFFRDDYDASLVLQDLAEQIRVAISREELASLLRRQLERALHPSSTVVYLASAEGRLRTDEPSVPEGLRELAADAAGLAELARRGRPLAVGSDPAGPAALLAPLAPECIVPIVGREARLLGLAVLGPRLSEEPYSRDDERLLASVASQAGVTLENMTLAALMAERLQEEHRAAHEIELARRVQARLLPEGGPRLHSLDCAGRCVQARSVGGDYYDFLDAGEGDVTLVLADVSGKGFAAALLVASLHASIRSQPREGDLASQLCTVNRLLYEATETNRYATLFVGRFAAADRRLCFVNCGHNPPLLLRRDGSLERLLPTASVIGLVDDWSAETGEVALCPGDLVVVYSDGITEAEDRDGREFGEARLVRTLEAHRDRDPGALLDVVFEEVRRFSEGEQADDQTMVIARVS